MAEPEQADLTTLTVELLSAFVSNNTIESGDLAGLIQTTHAALGSGLVDQSQKMTVAARAIAEKKAIGQRS